jgi:sec-independent protein translocase protein TatA
MMSVDPFVMEIAGTEWLIIILMGLFLLFGSTKLPALTRTLGKATGEYEKARDLFRRELEYTTRGADTRNSLPIGPRITSPVISERKKLEEIANTIGINHAGKTDDELRASISQKMQNL